MDSYPVDARHEQESADLHGLDLETYGLLCRLKNVYWLRGFLPVELHAMATWAGVPLKQLQKCWPFIERQFTVQGADLAHHELHANRMRIASRARKRSRAGKKAAKARWDKHLQSMRIACDSHADRIELRTSLGTDQVLESTISTKLESTKPESTKPESTKLESTEGTKFKLSTKSARARVPAPASEPELLDFFVELVNGLPKDLKFPRVKDARGKSIVTAWNRAWKDPECRPFIEDRDALTVLVGKIPQAKWALGKGFFSAAKLLGGRNKDGELVAEKVWESRYSGDDAGMQHEARLARAQDRCGRCAGVGILEGGHEYCSCTFADLEHTPCDGLGRIEKDLWGGLFADCECVLRAKRRQKVRF